jgi:hypothetical protein
MSMVEGNKRESIKQRKGLTVRMMMKQDRPWLLLVIIISALELTRPKLYLHFINLKTSLN